MLFPHLQEHHNTPQRGSSSSPTVLPINDEPFVAHADLKETMTARRRCCGRLLVIEALCPWQCIPQLHMIMSQEKSAAHESCGSQQGSDASRRRSYVVRAALIFAPSDDLASSGVLWGYGRRSNRMVHRYCQVRGVRIVGFRRSRLPPKAVALRMNIPLVLSAIWGDSCHPAALSCATGFRGWMAFFVQFDCS